LILVEYIDTFLIYDLGRGFGNLTSLKSVYCIDAYELSEFGIEF
jgi:hypothetical protein